MNRPSIATQDPPQRPRAYPALGIRARALILGLVLAQFLVLHGPVWRRMFDWDRSILASYATIPLLVFGALALRQRLGVLPWVIHTIEIAAIKFMLTASFLVAVLVASDDGARHLVEPSPGSSTVPARRIPPAPPAPRRALVPTVIPPGTTGKLAGTVSGPDGSPAAGAVAWISGGLERIVYATPAAPLAVENDGKGFAPSLVMAQTGQRFVARSTDGRLHTLLLVRGGDWLHNLPVPASGDAVPPFPPGLAGIVNLRCTVHGAREKEAHLLLTTHPFAAVVGADGRFAFNSVPQAELRVTAFHPGLGETSAPPVVLGPGQDATITLSFR